MKELLFILLLIAAVYCHSQTKKVFYLNEAFEPISAKEFEFKVNTNFYTNATFANDTTLFHKLRYREYFGKLSMNKKKQLNKLFAGRYNVDTTKVWLIHYKDSLPDITKMSKKTGFIILDSLGNEISEILSKKKYVNSDKRKGWNRHLYKYVKSYESFRNEVNVEIKYFGNQKKYELLHFFGVNNGYPVEGDDHNWIQDSIGIIPKLFTDGLLIYKFIVLHPDGNFYAITHGDSLDRQKRKLNYKLFLKAKKLWLEDYHILKNAKYQN